MKKGDVLAMYSPNIPEFGFAFFGTLACGGTVTTCNPLYTEDELAHQVGIVSRSTWVQRDLE
jgi:acyl-CoA synthetase (AMP-forming)/AMP-acid ligase II